MSKESQYIEKALIKLHREYSKDEYVSVLLKQISEKDIELGKRQSYIDELEHDKHQQSLKTGGEVWFEKYTKVNNQLKALNKEALKDEFLLMRKKENSALASKNKKLLKTNKELVHRIAMLFETSNLLTKANEENGNLKIEIEAMKNELVALRKSHNELARENYKLTDQITEIKRPKI